MTFEEFTASYPSGSHEKATPAAMRRVAKLLGLRSREVASSRILEIGCGSGANVLSLALLYPNAEFVGIDFSPVAVDRAKELARELGVTNAVFQISSLEEEVYGPGELYDYVIVPGLYSWMDHENQAILFQLINRVLAADGLAVVSYSTYPGWNVVRMVREMMLFHVAGFEDTEKRALEAQKLLNFVVSNNERKEEPYKELMEREADLINSMGTAAFAKAYLAPLHEGFYFSDFISAANRHGLAYTGDVEVEFMFLGNYAESARAQLGDVKDRIRQEQYLDFITNRRSRHTILAKQKVGNRTITAEELKEFTFRLKMVPKLAIDASTYDAGTVELARLDNRSVGATIAGKVPIACIDFMFRNFPKSWSAHDIAKGAAMITELSEEEVSAALDVLLVKAVVSGIFVLETEPDPFVRKVGARPKVFALARHQCSERLKVNNVLHQSVQLTTFDQNLIPRLDGQNGLEALIEHVETLLADGALSLATEGLDAEAETLNQGRLVKAFVEERLKFYAVNALLVT